MVLSRQPQNKPGVLQDEVAKVGGAVIVGAGVAVGVVEVVVWSWHPNHPGVLHVEVVVETLVEEVVVVGSLHPNQPGVLHVEVELLEEVVVVVMVVLPSKHPHQPGVLQIDVLVGIEDVAGEVVVVVVISEPLLLKNFQSSQS